MTSRARIRRVLALALALLLVPCAAASADRAAYDRVSAAYADGGGQLDACAFSQAELEGALAGIPKAFEDVVPDLRRAIEDAIATHRAGSCTGAPADGGAGAGATTPTTPPAVPGATETSAAPPPVDEPAPPAGTPPASEAPGGSLAPGQTITTPGVEQPGVKRDTTPLAIGAAALGTLLLLAALLWGWARLRGWDPTWAARLRHAWGEAGYRAAATWSEFADWLRLGR